MAVGPILSEKSAFAGKHFENTFSISVAKLATRSSHSHLRSSCSDRLRCVRASFLSARPCCSVNFGSHCAVLARHVPLGAPLACAAQGERGQAATRAGGLRRDRRHGLRRRAAGGDA
eukprot:1401431-Prymnesium_polylepis.1